MVTQEAYDELLKRYESLEARYEQMLPYMSYLQRMMFGARSERRLDPVNPLQGSLFAPPEPPEPVVVPTETITYERTKKSPGSHPGRKPLAEHLPRQILEVIHPEADPATMERIAEPFSEQLAMRPVQF